MGRVSGRLWKKSKYYQLRFIVIAFFAQSFICMHYARNIYHVYRGNQGWIQDFWNVVPRRWFFLWIICVIYVLCLSCFRICSLLPCGRLERGGWPLGSCLWCLLWFCYFPMLCPVTGVVLDCIDLWSLLSFLLSLCIKVWSFALLILSYLSKISHENEIIWSHWDKIISFS